MESEPRFIAALVFLVIAVLGGPASFWLKYNFQKKLATRIVVGITAVSVIMFIILIWVYI